MTAGREPAGADNRDIRPDHIERIPAVDLDDDVVGSGRQER
jgi:hypothetical protein